MAVNITLTSSMRSNLSSLKSLASQMSTTQVRLSTGKKVNNAIDNADSYYQARALTNRASDLDMLLDSMGQSIQTITSAVKGLEASGEILENAAVIAKKAYEAAIIPEKAWFEAQVGPNGAVVTSAQELRAAINANKSTICVYGHIDLGNITSELILNNNQKLVGIGYFGDFDSEIDKFSAISATAHNGISLIATRNNNLIADVSLNFEWTTDSTAHKGAIIARGNNAVLQNIDVKTKLNWTGASGVTHYTYGVVLYGGSINNIIKGYNIINGGLWNHKAELTIAENSKVNARLYIHGGNKSITRFEKGSLFIGNFATYGNTGKVELSVAEGAKIKANSITLNSYSNSPKEDIKIEKGAYIAVGNNYYVLESDYQYNELPRKVVINADNITEKMDVRAVEPWAEYTEKTDTQIEQSRASVSQNSEQYLTAITSFDDMISDSSYQGVNLLKGGKLTTMFNEDRTHSYTINGRDMGLSGLGITTREWQTKGDIAASIKEIQNAMISIRDEVARLGNNLSIIETRMNFTDGLVDVLQTGADDLVLADMNEESANYLALQTRNSLAVNALALAAQSNNAVLKLF